MNYGKDHGLGKRKLHLLYGDPKLTVCGRKATFCGATVEVPELLIDTFNLKNTADTAGCYHCRDCENLLNVMQGRTTC